MKIYYDEGDEPTEFTLPTGEMEYNVKDTALYMGGKHQEIITVGRYGPFQLELLNGWVDVVIGVLPFVVKVNGVVHLTGSIKDGDITKPLFILPEEFRPSNEIYPMTTSKAGVVLIKVKSNGEFYLDSSFTVNNEWATLDGVSFYVGD